PGISRTFLSTLASPRSTANLVPCDSRPPTRRNAQISLVAEASQAHPGASIWRNPSQRLAASQSKEGLLQKKRDTSEQIPGVFGAGIGCEGLVAWARVSRLGEST